MSEHVLGISARPALSPQDHLAICRVGAIYAMCSDYRCFDDLAALFTEDARWDGREFGFGLHEGRAVVTDGIAAFCAEGVEQIHFLGPTVTWGRGDASAGAITYFTALRKTSKGTRQAFGAYEDEYAIDGDAGWRITSRTLRLRLVP